MSDFRIIAMSDPKPFARALQGRRPDILHAHFAIDAVTAQALSRAFSIPLFVTLHGFDVTTRDADLIKSMNPTRTAFLMRRRKLQRTARLFLCVSEFIRRAALDKGYPPDRTITLPLGIDLTRYQPTGPGDGKMVLHVGRLVEKKGTIHLLHAFAEVLRAHPDALLVIAGDGPLLASLKERAAAIGVARSVRFLGETPHAEVLSLITQSSVVVVPSVTASNGDSEGLPTVIFEACAFAVPVVASDTSGIPEAVQHGRTGFLVPERDERGLVRAICTILENPELQRQFGWAGRRLAEDRYDGAAQTATLERLYDATLADS